MAFQLTITEGKDAGKLLTFEQRSVTIGRTPECDIILYDPGVSRQHARIQQEDAGFSVEDLGSANGTRVNGEVIQKTALKTGDTVSLGAVVFQFAAPEPESDEIDEADRTIIRPHPAQVSAEEGSTRIVSISGATRGGAPKDEDRTRIKAVPEGFNEDEGAALVHPRTGAMRSVPPVRAGRPSMPSLSAAERARIRRRSGDVSGRLRIFWIEAPPAVRALFIVTLVIGVLGGLGGLSYAYLKDSLGVRAGPSGAEPDQLGHAPIEESFGVGDGVRFPRPDKKIFYFTVNSPSRTVAVLHYQSRDVSQTEVAITVNGAALENVPPDTFTANERSHELFIPTNLIKKGEKNVVIFDNLHNPPAEDPWRVWNIWIEVAPLPDLPLDQLRKNAQDAYDRGLVLFDRRNIGADNGFKAWKEFRAAWLTLEAHPDPKPETYHMARERMRTTQGELDNKCSQLMLELQGAYSHKEWDAARATLDQVHAYFPTKEQPCPLRAEQRREELQL